MLLQIKNKFDLTFKNKLSIKSNGTDDSRNSSNAQHSYAWKEIKKTYEK